MTEKRKSLPSVRLPNVAIIVSRYNASLTDKLLEGALDGYQERGGNARFVSVFDAPGAFELPMLAMAAAQTGRYAGVVALGCVIKGETRHDRYINQAICEGIVNVSLISGVPVSLGVLTTETVKQAKERAGGRHGNKGHEAMSALLDTIDTIGAISSGTPSPARERKIKDKAKASKAKATRPKAPRAGGNG